ncbi:small membrane protein YohP [Yersinia artesiana]
MTGKRYFFILRLGERMKIILWIIAIIFIVGLLTITGVFKLIF